MKHLLVVLIALGLVLTPALARALTQDAQQPAPGADQKKEKKEKKKKKGKDFAEEAPTDPKDINREITQLLRELQFSLEGGSSHGVLSLIDDAKFDDYLRFSDNVERMMQEDTIRANFRQANTSPNTGQGKAQATVDAEMEIGRKDASGQVQRRRDQLVLDFEYTRRGWKIVNITPRGYFSPL